MQAVQVIQEPTTPSNIEVTISLHPKWQLLVHAYAHLLHVIWKKITLILLTLYSVQELSLAAVFLLKEYPVLEQQLVQHEISKASLETLIVEAMLLLFKSVLQIIVAVQLTKKKAILAELIDIIIGTCLLLFAEPIQRYVATLEIFAHFISR